MSTPHVLDDMFTADIDDAFEHEMRELFGAAQSPGTTEELASEPTIVATMVHAVRPQTSTVQAPKRRTPLPRPFGSRVAKVAVFAGIAVISTSAAAAAGVLPRPVQSAVERAVQHVGWDLPERHAPAATTMENPEPTTITIDRLDASARPPRPTAVTVDPNLTTGELCREWAFSIRSGIGLEPDAMRALIAMAESAGQVVERLCDSDATPAPAVLTATAPTITPEAVPTSTVSTVTPAVDATATTAPPSTNDITPNTLPPETPNTLPPETPNTLPPETPNTLPPETPNTLPPETPNTLPPETPNTLPPETPNTLPPETNGSGPPVGEPSRGDDQSTNGNGNANGNANPNANPNEIGNANPNANPNANANPNGNGAATDNPNGNANANVNGNGAANADPNGNGAATDPPSANTRANDHGSG